MKVEIRFPSKAPETIANVDRMIVHHGGVEYEVIPVAEDGIYLALRQPIGRSMVVLPNSNIGVTICPTPKK